MLHFAPEVPVARLLEKVPYIEYASADLSAQRAKLQMDITRLGFPDETFPVVYSSHVLEHVPDDRRAMAELCRVLRKGGWGVLQVPIKGERTFEDPTVTSPEDRRRLFGQHDHVRQYGKDYKNRLEEAGFHVQVEPFVRSMPRRRASYLGLSPEEDVYLCRRPACTAQPSQPYPV